ncbi:MAG: PfkB family carbohydrate kinase, partial [Pseudomonadota bacterium]
QGLDHDPSWLPIDGISQFGAVLGDLRWLQGTQRALKAARQAGVPGVLDADLTTHDGLTEAAGASSHIIFSEPALADCTGETDVNAGLRSAHRRFGGWLAVTMGAQGAYWTADGSTVHRQPAYEVDVIDTLGAGDVFHGAFAAELARGQNETEALRWAAAAAAMKCAQPGGRAGIPTRKALERFLREQA